MMDLKQTEVRLNMKILFLFMPTAFNNSSKPRNAFQFHSNH